MARYLRAMLLEVQNLTKRFPGSDGPITVLDGISFSLAAGETLALTGESGSGKSTLLHIIGGLEPADEGTVNLDGREITGLDDTGRAALRRSDIGIVFQQFNLIPSLTVGQNVTFQARLAGREDETRTRDLIRTLGLEPQVHKYPEELSGGQQQRVAIARAILPAPRLVLADEPTGNLDEATAETVFQTLLDLVGSSGAGLLLVTHSERLAARTDRRLHLSHGRIQT
ncbi:ABC transporter ATP-binding protein [Silicimonas sp. MF1-12-2]|uniref:ABC transporter ATP-binding protein n=1 Tax=Silicimonas sp. MF1-12-2 TaxID=3384793 RepID=UPI0039B3C9F7